MIALALALATGFASERFLPECFLAKTENILAFFRSQLVWISVLGIIASVLAMVAVNRWILHSFMNSADEHSCLFLAETLRMGKWWVEPHLLSDFFNVVHVGNRAGKWFSVYPPGWPLLLALGLKFEIQNWLNPVMTALALFFSAKAGEKVYGSGAAWLGVSLVVFTPFFMFNGASYFSHGTALLTISLFLFAYIHWKQSASEHERIAWATLAGLAVGYGLMTRYLTMAAAALPFLVYHFLPVLRKRRKWLPSDTIFLVLALLFILVVFWQNTAVTGKPFKAPNKFDKSWERLGFRDDYTPLDGAAFILVRFFFLMDWMPPAFVLLYFFSIASWRRLNPTQRLMHFGFLYPVIAYFFYYSWGGNQYGPRYYYEGLPFLALAVGHQVLQNWKGSKARGRKFLIGLLVISSITSAYQFKKHGEYFHLASSQRRALYDMAEQKIEVPAVVFIHGFLGDHLVLGEEDAVRNHPSLNQMILYAHDLGERNKELMAYYPDRVFYRGSFDRERKEPRLEIISP